jgi:hypothetical protein
MPVLNSGLTLYDVAFANSLLWLSSFLIEASAFGNEQNLPTRMFMPI